MLVHRRVTPSIKFAGTHLYTWVERGTVRVKCLAQEHNTVTPARARTRAARPGDERTNHEATAAPTADKSTFTHTTIFINCTWLCFSFVKYARAYYNSVPRDIRRTTIKEQQ